MNSLYHINTFLLHTTLGLYAILILWYGFETGVHIGLPFQLFLGLVQVVIAIKLLRNFHNFSENIKMQLYIYYASAITILAFAISETLITEYDELAIIPLILATYFVHITKQLKTYVL